MFNIFCKYHQLIPALFHIIVFLRRYWKGANVPFGVIDPWRQSGKE